MNANKLFNSFPDEIKYALMSKFNDYFNISKLHTIVVIPFYGLMCRYGNEVRPVLSHIDMNTLYFMTHGFNRCFKDTIVYPGKSPFMTTDSNKLSEFAKFQSKQQYILSRIFNESIGFTSTNEEAQSYQKILDEYKQFLDNFDEMCEMYPLPYNTAFDIKDTDELISYLDKLYSGAIKSDMLTRILLVYLTAFCFEQPSEYEKVKNFMARINGDLYLGHSCADQYLDKIHPAFSAEGAFDKPVVHCLQDFSTTYSGQIACEIMDTFALEMEKLYERNTTDSIESIKDRIEQIDAEKIYIEYNSTSHKKYKRVK